jgi:hypothetical protein
MQFAVSIAELLEKPGDGIRTVMGEGFTDVETDVDMSGAGGLGSTQSPLRSQPLSRFSPPASAQSVCSPGAGSGNHAGVALNNRGA